MALWFSSSFKVLPHVGKSLCYCMLKTSAQLSEMEMAKVSRMKLGSQGMQVSAQGLGCMNMTSVYDAHKPEGDMISLIHHAIENGVTFLDTADVFGLYTNELLLSKVLFPLYTDFFYWKLDGHLS